jgi:hypothetical protein
MLRLRSRREDGIMVRIAVCEQSPMFPRRAGGWAKERHGRFHGAVKRPQLFVRGHPVTGAPRLQRDIVTGRRFPAVALVGSNRDLESLSETTGYAVRLDRKVRVIVCRI